MSARLCRRLALVLAATMVVVFAPSLSHASAQKLAPTSWLTPAQLLSRSFSLSAARTSFRATWAATAHSNRKPVYSNLTAFGVYQLGSPKWLGTPGPRPPRFRVHVHAIGVPGKDRWAIVAGIGNVARLREKSIPSCAQSDVVTSLLNMGPTSYGQVLTGNEFSGENPYPPVVPENTFPLRILLEPLPGQTLSLLRDARLQSGPAWHVRLVQTTHDTEAGKPKLHVRTRTEADYFIGMHDYTLRQVRVHDRFTALADGASAKHVVSSSTLRATFFDYGRPVHIQMPPTQSCSGTYTRFGQVPRR